MAMPKSTVVGEKGNCSPGATMLVAVLQATKIPLGSLSSSGLDFIRGNDRNPSSRASVGTRLDSLFPQFSHSRDGHTGQFGASVKSQRPAPVELLLLV
jgi:hypothetical protein